MKQILLVEDDPGIIQLLDLHLNSNTLQLIARKTAAEALLQLSQSQPDMIILDIMLPDQDGLELCKIIRTQNTLVPIMILTSRTEEKDKVLALELGADDYLAKPFGLLELMARVKAHLRREEKRAISLHPINASISVGDLIIDQNKKLVTLKGKRLNLTAKEYELLVLLACNPGKTFTRKELLDEVWGFAFKGYEHTITSHINRLRIKIETNIDKPSYILTSWGTGYRFSG